MAIPLNQLALALAGAALLTVAGCGGGGSGGNGGGPAQEAKTSVPVTVIDGAIQNALVCLDTNTNGLCDTGEPSGRTDAAGKVTLEVPEADAGKYPIVAMVGTDAKDADTGDVKTAYTLKAPADQTQVVSPLITLVHAYQQTAGGTSAQAAAIVQEQLGLGTASPFADFTQDTSAAGKQAGTVARLIVVTTQAQRAATAGATDADGKALTPGQIDSAINGRLIGLLQQMILAVLDDPQLSDPSISIADKQAKIEAAAQQIAQATGLNRDNIGAVAAPRQGGPADEAAGDTLSLRWFTFTDLQNYMFRAFEATAAQNTPDANGKTHYTEIRERQVNGVESEWGQGANNWTRPQVYWTGAEWFDCPTNFVHESTPVNAAGESESLYCNASRSRSTRSNRDISGRPIIDVVREIRAYAGTDASYGSYANWGPNPDLPAIQSALGTAVFPAGSVLSLRTMTDLGGAEYYDRTKQARIPQEATPDDPDYDHWRTATLEEFVAWNTGDFARSISAVHGNNSFVLLNRNYTKLDGSPAYKRYMVGFDSGSGKARFYQCEGNMATRSETPPRNSTLFINGVSTCAPILEATYTITAKGDGRVLQFSAQPAQLGENHRLFVERNGVGYLGYRDKPQVSIQQRLNWPAADALLGRLGLGDD